MHPSAGAEGGDSSVNTVLFAHDCTDDERRFMRSPPYIVAGKCGTCSRIVKVRVYGLKSELQQAKLVCAECKKR